MNLPLFIVIEGPCDKHGASLDGLTSFWFQNSSRTYIEGRDRMQNFNKGDPSVDRYLKYFSVCRSSIEGMVHWHVDLELALFSNLDLNELLIFCES